MPSYPQMQVERLAKLIGTGTTPVLSDIRTKRICPDLGLMPGARRTVTTSRVTNGDWLRCHCSAGDNNTRLPTPGGLDLSPEAAGLLAAPLCPSRNYDDDLEQLERVITLRRVLLLVP